MEKATISQLKNQLSAYLAKVKAGSLVLIFDRDQPIAQLERVPPGCQGDDRLGRLERAGIIRRGTGKIRPELLRQAAVKPTRSLVEALLEERAEGR
jgi:antitoxin (DNA-binding transcriptional repressor) of toxin-antitoxin stability system